MMKYPMFLLLTLVFLFGNSVFAAMQSDSYVINENIHHSFDGPIITNVSDSVTDSTLTVAWTTNAPASSFIEYSTALDFSGSQEQGTAANVTSHSVDVTGLDFTTTYYYRVKSKRVNGGIRLSSPGTITTGTDPTPAAESGSSSGGGGLLIIDKTDKIPPVISDVIVEEVGFDYAEISWKTDEDATSFIEYGGTEEYGNIAGSWNFTTEHRTIIKELKPITKYNFKILSNDDWGNLGESENYVFTTLNEDGTKPEEGNGEQEVKGEEETKPPDELTLAEASARALELLNKLAGEVSTNVLEKNLLSHLDSIKELAQVIPAPLLSGEPRVEIESNKATIYWRTDKEANSQVAVAPENEYNPNRTEPYIQIVGNTDETVQDHVVTIFGLEPDTLYHYQLRSRAAVGPLGRSRDFTFRTKLKTIEITSFFTQVINDNSANVKWVTNKDANSEVKFTPYRGSVLSLDESKTKIDNTNAVIHEIKIDDLQPGVFYNLEISSTDEEGNTATESIDRFSTAEDDLPPIISQIKTDSTIFVDKGKVQTIMSWFTNEPATTRVSFMEGVHGGDKKLSGSTDQTDDYTKEHTVVITKFKPGTVYSFRVESTDSGGNTTISKAHTFMTPKQRESIIDVIIRILEDTFGWIKDIV